MDPDKIFSTTVNQIKFLKKNAIKLKTYGTTEYKIDYHTCIKLISVRVAIETYLRIMRNNIRAKGMFNVINYVDLCAGSGINQIGLDHKKVDLYGSPIIAVLSSKERFDGFYCFDLNKDSTGRYQANIPSLKSRLPEAFKLHPNYKNNHPDVIIEKYDFNLIHLHRVMKKISNKKTHNFIFIDPYGLELDFQTVKNILRETCSDLLIYISHHGLHRVIKNLKDDPDEQNRLSQWASPGVKEYINTTEYQNLNKRHMVELYLKDLEQIPDLRQRPRIKSQPLPVNEKTSKGKKVKYYLAYLTVKTETSESEWFDKVIGDYLHELQKILDDEYIKSVFEHIEKIQSSLNDYL